MVAEVNRVGAVRIFVRDIARARVFYGDILNLPDRIDGDAFSAFRLSGVDVVVEVATADQAELVGRFTGVSFAVADVDAVVTEIRNAGVVITGTPEKQDWGGIMAHVADPDGNEITLVEYPAAQSGTAA